MMKVMKLVCGYYLITKLLLAQPLWERVGMDMNGAASQQYSLFRIETLIIHDDEGDEVSVWILLNNKTIISSAPLGTCGNGYERGSFTTIFTFPNRNADNPR